MDIEGINKLWNHVSQNPLRVKPPSLDGIFLFFLSAGGGDALSVHPNTSRGKNLSRVVPADASVSGGPEATGPMAVSLIRKMLQAAYRPHRPLGSHWVLAWTLRHSRGSGCCRAGGGLEVWATTVGGAPRTAGRAVHGPPAPSCVSRIRDISPSHS